MEDNKTAINKLKKLQSELQTLETVRLPRLLERIELLKSEITLAEEGAAKEDEYNKTVANISDEQKALYQRIHKPDWSLGERERHRQYIEINRRLIESLNLEISTRDRQILGLLASGISLKSVGEQVGLSGARVRDIQYKQCRRIRIIFEKAKVATN